jgi:hypothetical protein
VRVAPRHQEPAGAVGACVGAFPLAAHKKGERRDAFVDQRLLGDRDPVAQD